jgi:hypothetical protein
MDNYYYMRTNPLYNNRKPILKKKGKKKAIKLRRRSKSSLDYNPSYNLNITYDLKTMKRSISSCNFNIEENTCKNSRLYKPWDNSYNIENNFRNINNSIYRINNYKTIKSNKKPLITIKRSKSSCCN